MGLYQGVSRPLASKPPFTSRLAVVLQPGWCHVSTHTKIGTRRQHEGTPGGRDVVCNGRLAAETQKTDAPIQPSVCLHFSPGPATQPRRRPETTHWRFLGLSEALSACPLTSGGGGGTGLRDIEETRSLK